METRASYVLVGAFVMGLIVAGVFLVLWLAGSSESGQTNAFKIYFRGNVTGLQKGSSVLFRGIPVGEVTQIRIDPENSELIEVSVKVRDTTPIKTDTKAQIEAQLLSGSATILLRGGSHNAPLLKPKKGKNYAVLQGQPSPFAEIVPSAQKSLASITKAADRLSAMLDKSNEAEFRAVLKSAHDALLSADKALKSADKTLVSYRKLADSAKTLVDDLRPAAKELKGAITAFRGTGEQAQAMLKENRRPIRQFTATGLNEFNLFLLEARRFVKTFNRVLIKLENDPARFLFGKQQRGFRGR